MGWVKGLSGQASLQLPELEGVTKARDGREGGRVM